MIDKCPECGEELSFDEVDIGVGIMRGNIRCDFCEWTPEAEENSIITEDEKGD